MTIELKIADESDSNEWDILVERSPHGTIYHTWKWLKIAEKHTNSKLYPIIGYKGTTPIGVFPLFYQRKALLKMVFSPPPHTAIPYLGPALVDYDKLKQFKKEIIFVVFQKRVDEFINDKLSANYISISLPPGLLDPRPFKWAGYNVEHGFDYRIELSKGIDHMWQQLKKRLRQHINQAIRVGISVEEGYKEELKTIYELLIKRYAEQDKMVTVPKNYLLELHDSFSKNMKVFVVKHDGEILSGAIDVYYKDKVISWIGNPKPSVKISPSPNDLLNWEEMKCGHKYGFRYYETVGAAGNERLHSYYSKFNPELLVRFSAKRYSYIAKGLETSYVKILKPMSARFRLSWRK